MSSEFSVKRAANLREDARLKNANTIARNRGNMAHLKEKVFGTVAALLFITTAVDAVGNLTSQGVEDLLFGGTTAATIATLTEGSKRRSEGRTITLTTIGRACLMDPSAHGANALPYDEAVAEELPPFLRVSLDDAIAFSELVNGLVL